MWHEKLHVYRESVSLAEDIGKEVARWQRGMGYLADQVRRAMSSVVLNVCEGNEREGMAERRRFFRIAKGSGSEVAACIDLMWAFKLIGEARAHEFKVRINRIDRMLWGLLR